MRPFQIPLGGPWVDLDSIQTITPPRLLPPHYGVPAQVALEVQHAFRERSDRYYWEQPRAPFDPDGPSELFDKFVPTLGADGVPDRLSTVWYDVYIPLWRAWTGSTQTPAGVPPRWEP
jgi:hypothetical protein